MKAAIVRSTSDSREALHRAGILAAKRAIRAAYRDSNRAIASSAITIEKEPLGKPQGRVAGRSASVAVSISHAFPFSLSVATLREQVALGTDIERIRDFRKSTWQAFVTAAEKAYIARAPKTEQSYLRTLAWSLKESVLKMLGIGIRMHPRHVDISTLLAQEPEAAQTIAIKGVPYPIEAHGWRVGASHVATMIAFQHPSSIMSTVWNCETRSSRS